ncbi:efflux RND transporter periplasmic adaptor subunit [Neptunicella sp. SCSIO 80796]|uniref:efflux RND transporter periplasmic adaptor subunit n=1 Tax=Neptunicella plasticusilytica TaxID=3117012 RepID=UPI003A4E047E
MRILLCVLLHFFISPVWSQALSTDIRSHDVDGTAVTTRYICPMHSHIIKDHPGKCPICGMTLEAHQMPAMSSSLPSQIHVDSSTQQAMNIVTTPVQRGDMWKYIQTLGEVSFDQANISHVHPRMSGWIESLNVDTQGQRIEKGQLLYTLYSPDLVVAQDDFIQALNNLEGSKNRYLLEQARKRLSLLGVNDEVIQQIEKQRQSRYSVPFYAQQSGIVTALNVRKGMYVQPEQEMLAIADLTRLWVLADVFENQFDWLKIGKPAEIHLPTIGVHKAQASIAYIYPQLDPVTRSIKVRLDLANPDMRIKPGMTADVVIYGGPKSDVLNIPLQAVITSAQGSRVIVQNAAQQFEVRQIETGMQVQDRIEVLSGLEEDESLVVSGQFLIDSEASLNASFGRMSPHANMQHH